jgi:hypothetical protein
VSMEEADAEKKAERPELENGIRKIDTRKQ